MKFLQKVISNIMAVTLLAGSLLSPVSAVITYAQDDAQPSSSITTDTDKLVTDNKDLIEPNKLEEAEAVQLGIATRASDVNEPQTIREADGVKIENATIEWITKDSVPDSNPLLLNQKWTDNEPQNVRFKWNISISGAKPHEPGAIKMTIPKHMFKDRTGKNIGRMTLAVPKAPDKSGMFSYIETPDSYVLTNTKRVVAATSAVFETTVRDLIPSEIKDMSTGYKTDPINMKLEVTTPQGTILSAITDEIIAKIDTKSYVEEAKAYGVGYVGRSFGSEYPNTFKLPNSEEYYYARFDTSVLTKGSQYSNIGVSITPYTSRNGEAIILGYKDNLTGKLFKGNGRPGTLTLDNIIENRYHKHNQRGLYGTVYVAYKKSQIPDNQTTYLGITHNYKLTDYDDQEISITGTTGEVIFVPTKLETPTGSFWFEKHGDSTSNKEYNDGKYIGVYSDALNRFQKNRSMRFTYSTISRAYGYTFTRDKTMPESDDAYHRKDYTVRVVDDNVKFNGVNLTSEDFKFLSLDFERQAFFTYQRYKTDGFGYYETAEGGVKARQLKAGEYGYVLNNNQENNPIFIVYGKEQNGNYIKYAEMKFSNGSWGGTAFNGATVDGKRVTFPTNVNIVNWKYETTTKIAAFILTINPAIRVNPTKKIKDIVKDLFTRDDSPRATLSNFGEMTVDTQDGKNVPIRRDEGINRLESFSTAIDLVKTSKYEGNTSKQRVELEYTGVMSLETNAQEKSVLQENIDSGFFQEEKEGIFYDLLPVGVVPDLNSVMMLNGDKVVSTNLIRDYKGSGRILMIVKARLKPNYKYKIIPRSGIRGFASDHTIKYKATYTYTNIDELGDVLDNRLAYQSINDTVGTIKGYKGEPDAPTGAHVGSKDATQGVEELMTDLNPDHDLDAFVYAKDVKKVVVDRFAVVNLNKTVDVNNENSYTDGLDNDDPKNVYEGGLYSYRINVRTDEVSQSTDMIFYDKLEAFSLDNHLDDRGDARWKGTLINVDTKAMESAGVNPVVYYSTKQDIILDNSDDRSHNDLSNKTIWSTTMPSDKSTITAIAIDARKKVDGSDFILDRNKSLSAYIRMRAPFIEENLKQDYYDKRLEVGEQEAGLTGGAHAYNNIVMTSVQIQKGTDARSQNQLSRQDYTKVGLKPRRIHIDKDWSDDDNRDGIRPDSIVIELIKNGKPSGRELTLTKEGGWIGTFDNLETMDDNGEEIQYTLREKNVSGYHLVIPRVEVVEDGYKYHLLNVHNPETIDITGTKTWSGDLSTMPKSVHINLLKNGQIINTATANELTQWKYAFNNLFKYENGKEINYQIEEQYVPGFQVTYLGNDILNTYNPKGSLVISKEIDVVTDSNRNEEFSFVINFKNMDETDSPISVNYTTNFGKTGVLSNGSEFILKQGEKLTVAEMPSDIKYEIRENKKTGYETIDLRSGFVKAGEAKVETLQNKYRPVGFAILDVRKVLENRKLQNSQFVFDLLDENGRLVRSVMNNADGSVNFGILEYSVRDIGKTYTYKIKERNTAAPGYIYDDTEHIVSVRVFDQPGGTLGTEVTYLSGNSITFTNIYRASGEISLRSYKVMKFSQPLEEGKFKFEIRKKDSQEVIATGTNGRNGEIEFSKIKFTEQDIDKTYKFVATEVAGDDQTIIYDSSSIEFTVKVFDNGDGSLSFETNALDTKTDDYNNESTLPIFVNKYKNGSLTIAKTVIEGSPNNKEFKFKVKFKGEEGMIPNGNIEGERQSSNNNTSNNQNNNEQDVATVVAVIDLSGGGPKTLGTLKSNGELSITTNQQNSNRLWALNGPDGTKKLDQALGKYAPSVKKIVMNNIFLYSGVDLFRGLNNLEEIDFGNTNTRSVKSIAMMFNGLSKLKKINMKNFESQNIQHAENAFSGLDNLNEIILPNDFRIPVEEVALESSSFQINELYGYQTEWDIYNGLTNEKIEFPENTSIVTWYKRPGFAVPVVIDRFKYDKDFYGSMFLLGVLQDLKFNNRDLNEDDSIHFRVTDLGSAKDKFTGGHWIRQRNSYTVIFNTTESGVIGNAPDKTVLYEEKVELPRNIFKKGYELVGWANGTMYKEAAENYFNNPSSNPTLSLKELLEFQEKSLNSVQNSSPLLLFFDDITIDNNTFKPVIPKNMSLGSIDGDIVNLYPVWRKIDNSVNVQNGEFEVSVKPGDKFTINDLPAGLIYEVYEETPSGWQLVSTENTSGVIAPTSDSEAKFVNKYNPLSTTIQLSALKTVDGSNRNVVGYTFNLLGENGEIIHTAQSDASGNVKFPIMEFNAEGVHNYTIVEATGNNPIMNYDTSRKNVQVTISKDVEGNFKADVVGDKQTFNNTTKLAKLKITKQVVGTDANDKEFSVKVTINNEVQDLTIRNNQIIEIPNVKYGSRVTIEENNIPAAYTLESINFDNVVDSEVENITVINRYNASGSVEIQARKLLEGRTLKANEFTFELLKDDQVLSTATNDADGNIIFDAIDVNGVGENTYTIREVIPADVKGIKYDTHVETVKVITEDDGEGNLIANVEYDNDGAIFTNEVEEVTDKPDDNASTPKLTISKRVVGGTDVTNNAKFKVLFSSSNTTKEYKYVSNKLGGGTIKSGEEFEIMHDEVITITNVSENEEFTIEESVPIGYTLDSSSKTNVTITQLDNKLELINNYQARGQWQPTFIKRLVDGDISQNKYQFAIFKDGDIMQLVWNNEDGTIPFNPLMFTAEDAGKTHQYQIIEMGNGDGVVVKDQTVHTINISVTDNGDGTLSVISDQEGTKYFVNRPKRDLPETGTLGAIGFILIGFGLIFVAVKKREKE